MWKGQAFGGLVLTETSSAVSTKAAGSWDKTLGSLVHCYQRFPRRVSQGQDGIGSRANEERVSRMPFQRESDWENEHEVEGSLEKLTTRTASSQGQSGWKKT